MQLIPHTRLVGLFLSPLCFFHFTSFLFFLFFFPPCTFFSPCWLSHFKIISHTHTTLSGSLLPLLSSLPSHCYLYHILTQYHSFNTKNNTLLNHVKTFSAFACISVHLLDWPGVDLFVSLAFQKRFQVVGAVLERRHVLTVLAIQISTCLQQRHCCFSMLVLASEMQRCVPDTVLGIDA